MKNSVAYFLLFCVISLLACNSSNSNEEHTKRTLIEKLISHSEVVPTKVNGKVIILQSDYCKEVDCEAYFKEYKDQIKIYSREDLFMRGINNYFEIGNIDIASGRMIISRKNGNDSKNIEIGVH